MVEQDIFDDGMEDFDGEEFDEVPAWEIIEINRKRKVPPPPIGKPQVVPPIRKPEVAKKHITKTGK